MPYYHSNAIAGVDSDFFVAVARGSVSGASTIRKFGRNDNIASGNTEDIWAGGGSRAYLSSAETMNVASTSASDDGDPVGTGARTIQLEGLNASYAETSESITMNGTSAVTSSNSHLRVHRAYVLTAGSNESNVGDITIDPTTSGSGSRQAFIAADDGQTLISHYTIPASKTGYVVGGQVALGKTAGANARSGIFRFWCRPSGGAWRLQQEIGASLEGTSSTSDFVFTVPAVYAAQTDLRWTCTSDTNSTTAYVQYNVLLIDD